ncbi:MAG: cell wall hydrolase [Clostridia bacterium]
MLLKTLNINKFREQRKVMVIKRRTIVSILLVISLLGLIYISNKLIQIEKANNIVLSAQEEADNIIFSAQEKADNIIFSTEEKAKIILHEANKKANQQLYSKVKNAEKIAKKIKKSAKDEAAIIIKKSINTKIDDIEVLLAITEKEAGDQPIKGKAAVASTILNRIKSNDFPDNAIDVVYSPGQFQPVSNGTIKNAIISNTTYKAVKIALKGKDYSNGALYFYNPNISDKCNKQWFNTLTTTAIIKDHIFKK